MNTEDRILLDSVEVPVFALEPDDEGRPRYVAFNQLACDIANVSATQIIGRTALDVYPGRFGRIAYGRHCEALASRKAVSYEITLPINGRNRQVRTHLKPIFDDQDCLLRLIGTSTDITAEYAVREVQAKSEIFSSELEQFVSLAAHDLRSPIISIRALTNLLREDFDDRGDGKLDLINMLEDVAIKATALISDVLSHAQATGTSKAIEEFEIGKLCRDILSMLDPTGQHKLNVEDCVIVGDKVVALVVLRNLIDNAVKHNIGQSISICVSIITADSDMYQLTIKDNGAGFPDSAKAFLDGGTFRSDSGFGLLGIQRLIRARGGDIAADSPDSGTGAIVKMTLPGRILAK